MKETNKNDMDKVSGGAHMDISIYYCTNEQCVYGREMRPFYRKNCPKCGSEGKTISKKMISMTPKTNIRDKIAKEIRKW